MRHRVRAAVRAFKTRDPCRGTQGHMEAVAAEQATAESDRDTGALFVLPAAGTAAERTFTHSVGATVGSVSVAHTVRVWVRIKIGDGGRDTVWAWAGARVEYLCDSCSCSLKSSQVMTGVCVASCQPGRKYSARLGAGSAHTIIPAVAHIVLRRAFTPVTEALRLLMVYTNRAA